MISRDMVGLYTLALIRKDKAEIFNPADSATAEAAIGVFGIMVIQMKSFVGKQRSSSNIA